MFNNCATLKLKISIGILIAFYVSGVIGILTNNQTIDFLSLTPLNLLINAALLFLNHQNGTNKQLIVFLIIAVVGFFIEAIGVNTGLIFGNYVYKTTLGWKFLETPLIIGINWILLTCAVVFSIDKKIKSKLGIAFASACLLVLLDVLIEPVAIRYDFWSWDETIVPIKNYIAWFIISFIFCYTIAYYKGKSKNNLAPYLLILQFMFFGIFNFIIWK
jgi:putative membrane protein